MTKVPFYYGWIILVALSLTEMMALGTTSYAAGLFVLPLQQEFGLSRAAASSPLSILLLGAMIAAPFVGRHLDRFRVQWVLSLGGLAIGFAFAAIALSSSLWLMAAALFLPAAIGFIATSSLTTGTLLSRWFYRRRGLALGIGAIATSGGGIFVAPWLSELIQSHGWRSTLLIEAVVITAISVLLAIFVVRNHPADLGLEAHRENENRPPQELTAAMRADLSWKKILLDRAFWSVAFVLAVVSGISQALVTTLPPYAVQLGFDVRAAAQLILFFALAAAATKILGGALTDFINRRLIMTMASLIMIAAVLVLLISASYMALAIAAVLAGVALGCVLPSSSALIAAMYGSGSFGSVMGWAYVLLLLSAIILPPVTGWIFDASHSYKSAFLFFAALCCLSALSAQLLPKREH